MRRQNKLLLLLNVFVLLAITCSSGYITPGSLTATAEMALIEDTPFPTAFLVVPTDTATALPLPTDTPDPLFQTATGLAPEEIIITPPTATPTVSTVDTGLAPIVYTARSGDTLGALAARFGVNPFEIVSDQPIPEQGFINPGTVIVIPQRLVETTSGTLLIPDSDLVYSPTAIGFDPVIFTDSISGYLSAYREYLGSTGWQSGGQIIRKIANDNSLNPRVLLSLLEYLSHWVLSNPQSLSESDYPMGFIEYRERGLHPQMIYAANTLSDGYYGWRRGSLTELIFRDGTIVRLHPELNAGTAAIHYYFSRVLSYDQYRAAVDPQNGYAALHAVMFGDPWARAASVEPLLPPNLAQPQLILPFLRNQVWAYTGGPHGAWGSAGALAAVDFAPGSAVTGCVPSDLWATAVAAGIVVRRATGVVVLDLDGDGNEQTGWNILYLHIAAEGAPLVGAYLEPGEFVGHPSCEGGTSTGTHIHIARKYNGEWIEAGGPLPFELSGWVVQQGEAPYLGFMLRGEDVIESCTCGSFKTKITRRDDDPY
jgi:LysM repeat protein